MTCTPNKVSSGGKGYVVSHIGPSKALGRWFSSTHDMNIVQTSPL